MADLRRLPSSLAVAATMLLATAQIAGADDIDSLVDSLGQPVPAALAEFGVVTLKRTGVACAEPPCPYWTVSGPDGGSIAAVEAIVPAASYATDALEYDLNQALGASADAASALVMGHVEDRDRAQGQPAHQRVLVVSAITAPTE